MKPQDISCVKNTNMKRIKQTSIVDIPNEVLLIIFGYLGLLDLKNVLLVRRRWKSVGEVPNLWSKCGLTLDQGNKDHLDKCLSLQRFSKVHKLKFYRVKLNCHDFNKIFNSRINSLQMKNCNLKGVHPTNLSKCVNALEKVDFDHSRIGSFQLKCILTSITEKTNLKHLDISDIDLSNIDPDILGGAVNNIEEVHLAMTVQASLTTNQLKAILLQLAQSPNSKLKVLNLNKNVLFNVPSDLLAFAVNKLEQVHLCGIDAFREQIIDIFEVMAENTNLKSLDISNINLTNVPPKSLVKSLKKLEELVMFDVHISKEQFELIRKEVDDDFSYDRCYTFNNLTYYSVKKKLMNKKRCHIKCI